MKYYYRSCTYILILLSGQDGITMDLDNYEYLIQIYHCNNFSSPGRYMHYTTTLALLVVSIARMRNAISSAACSSRRNRPPSP